MDKVHPAARDSSSEPSPANSAEMSMSKNANSKYVIQVPKDQIYRVPPPENAHRYKLYTRRGRRPRRSCCCCCLAWISTLLLLLLLSLAIASAVLYFVFHPKLPTYSVANLSVNGFNLTASQGNPLSPEFNLTIRVENPNKKIRIEYKKGSSVTIFYSGVGICTGAWPAFNQGRQNVRWVWTALRAGSRIRLSGVMARELAAEELHKAVPLVVDVRVPVSVKMGAATTWTMTVKARCAVVVDRFAKDSKLLTNKCLVKVKPF